MKIYRYWTIAWNNGGLRDTPQYSGQMPLYDAAIEGLGEPVL